MGVRKNQVSLTAIERAAFISAVKAVKANGTYDIFVEQHRTAMLDRNINPVDPAHLGPAFLPWHREYLHRGVYWIIKHSAIHMTLIHKIKINPVKNLG